MQKRPVAVVTGASSGFGMLTSVALAEVGYKVISSMRNPELRDPLDKLAITKNVSDFIEVIPLDVTSEEQIASAVSAIIATHHQIDLLVNNAGYACGGFVEEISAEQWRKQFDVNVFGVIDVTRAVLPSMRERQNAKSLLPWKWIEYFVKTKGISPGSDSD